MYMLVFSYVRFMPYVYIQTCKCTCHMLFLRGCIRYMFHEIQNDRDSLKRQMARSEDRTLAQLRSLAQGACDVFRGFNQDRQNGQDCILERVFVVLTMVVEGLG